MTRYDQRATSCSMCGTEIASNDRYCTMCGYNLVPDSDEEHDELENPVEQESGEVKWTIVRTVSTVVEAELMAGRLRANGIPAIVLSQVDSTRNFTIGGLAIVKLFVPERFAVEASALLDTDAELPDELTD